MLVKSIYRGVQVSDRMLRLSSLEVTPDQHASSLNSSGNSSFSSSASSGDDKLNLSTESSSTSSDQRLSSTPLFPTNSVPNFDELVISVIASHDIPCGVSTLPSSKSIYFRNILERKVPNNIIKAFVDQQGLLSTKKSGEWAHLIRLADNCFEQNVILQWTMDKRCLVAQTTRTISEGEELRAWFSPELLSVFGIPFLRPKNILSHQSYKCHRCERLYNQPNPLKIHLAVECTFLEQTTVLPPLPNIPLITIPLSLTTGTPPLFISNRVDEHDRARSDFNEKNKCKSSTETVSERSSTTPTFATKEPRTHVCMFCGKLYTRKYGLKIHLRTHTGHKPLQCRFCGRPFSDPSNLNKHIRLHSQNNSATMTSPYRCKKCSKILVRRRDLERHLRSRHK
ncbi:uncharacterized protein LOC141855215 [Brevipalpus obovatus]|uniref:uncharacterized protein LOC141855215 n=1 Tax=Brevipalpus obovatus TaxID=246614 RepID=UPI003D9F7598